MESPLPMDLSSVAHVPARSLELSLSAMHGCSLTGLLHDPERIGITDLSSLTLMSVAGWGRLLFSVAHLGYFGRIVEVVYNWP